MPLPDIADYFVLSVVSGPIMEKYVGKGVVTIVI
jgi:hypothetical protein